MKMKSYVMLTTMAVLLISLDGKWCSASETDLSEGPSQTNKLSADFTSRKLMVVWKWLKGQLSNPNSFIGRCLGAAKGLKVAIPLIVFKLGVIVTIVAFIAIFSLKALGLLGTLLFINLSGFFTRFGFLRQNYAAVTPHQTVHYHLHDPHGQHYIRRYFPSLSYQSPDDAQEEWINQKYLALYRQKLQNEQSEVDSLYDRMILSQSSSPYDQYNSE